MVEMDKLENIMASWYGKLPHLSGKARIWLADNCWWLILVIIVVTVGSIAAVLSLSLLTGFFLAAMGGMIGAVAGSVIALFVLASAILTTVNAVLLALAIGPTRRKEYRGWRLVFIVVLISIAAAVIKFFVDFSLSMLVVSVVLSGVVGYLLFEIRSHFSVIESLDTTAEKTEKQTA